MWPAVPPPKQEVSELKARKKRKRLSPLTSSLVMRGGGATAVTPLPPLLSLPHKRAETPSQLRLFQCIYL